MIHPHLMPPARTGHDSLTDQQISELGLHVCTFPGAFSVHTRR